MSKEAFQEKLHSLNPKLTPDSHLLIVSKTRSEDEIKTYYDLGHRDFGENRVQELSDKAHHLLDSCPDIRWHMIGGLQTNKVNQLFSVPNLWAVHSVDRKELLEKMLKAEDRLSSELNLFLQFNTSKEEEKSGFEDYQALKESALLISQKSKIKLYGLMTMGTIRTDNFEQEARRCFHELNQTKTQLQNELGVALQTSMGMSQDYLIALEEKSNWIRLGTMLFT